MLRRVTEFGHAMFAKWFIAMSGSLCVPLTIVGCFFSSGVTQKVLIATGLICGIYAAFLVWLNERETAETERCQKLVAQEELAAIKMDAAKIDFYFEESDQRCFEDTGRLHYFDRYWRIGIANMSQFKTAFDVSIKLHDCELVRHLVSGWRRPIQEPVLLEIAALHPQAIEFFNVFEVSSNVASTTNVTNAALRTVQKFVIEARARDIKTVIAEFEYEPSIPPKIRRLS